MHQLRHHSFLGRSNDSLHLHTLNPKVIRQIPVASKADNKVLTQPKPDPSQPRLLL
jgi:hypothetical protein